MARLYAKVRAYLAGGTAGAGIAGLVLWILDASGVETPESASVAITGLVSNAIGLFLAYNRTETGPVKRTLSR